MELPPEDNNLKNSRTDDIKKYINEIILNNVEQERTVDKILQFM